MARIVLEIDENFKIQDAHFEDDKGKHRLVQTEERPLRGNERRITLIKTGAASCYWAWDGVRWVWKCV
jgi:hypothetical protein